MKREEWQNAYPLPEARVSYTLAHLESEPVRHFSLRTAVVVLALLLALGGVAYAIWESQTANVFGWFFGESTKQELLSGDVAAVGQSMRLGDVIYTVDDAIFKDGTIYGSGTMRAAEDANLVLLTDEENIFASMGYDLLYQEQTELAEDAPSYVQVAEQRGAKLTIAHCVANGLVNADGTLNSSEVGISETPQEDGSIRFTFEFMGSDGASASPIERAESYQVSLHIANWEVSPEGEWLREEPNDTWQKTDWVVTVTPTKEDE